MLKPPNKKQQRFILEYLKTLNGTSAAILAGYSPKTAAVIACELLRKPNIKAEIEAKTSKISEKEEINVAWVVKELVNLKKTAKNEGVKLGAIEFLGKWQGMLKDKGDAPTTIVLNTKEIERVAPNG